MRRSFEEKDRTSAFEAIAGNADDRTSGIVGAGFVEHELEKAIQARLIALKPEWKKLLFENYGPFSDFNSKIDVGFAFALYGEITRLDLHEIRRIRNTFAHSIRPATYNDPDIKSRCLALKLPERLSHAKFTEPKTRYILVVIKLIRHLGRSTSKGRAPKLLRRGALP